MMTEIRRVVMSLLVIGMSLGFLFHFILIGIFKREHIEEATNMVKKEIFAKKAKENLVTSTGGVHPQPCQNSDKAAIDTKKELAKITNLNQSRISQIIGSININITDNKRKLKPSDYITVLKRSINNEIQEEIAKIAGEGQAIKDIEAEKAKERDKATQFGGDGNVSTPVGKTRDIVAAKIGVKLNNIYRHFSFVKSIKMASI